MESVEFKINSHEFDSNMQDLKSNQVLFSRLVVKNFDRLEHITPKSVERIKSCSTFFDMVSNKDFSEHKILKINACNQKYCPICQNRRAAKESIRIGKAMKLMSVLGYDFYFLTLTVKNVPISDFKETVSRLQKAFNRFIKYKDIKDQFKGYLNKFEFTRNWSTGEFHPHFHVLIAVKSGVILDSHKLYLLWEKANRVVGNQEDMDERAFNLQKVTDADKASKELSKYVAKSTDVMFSDYDFIEILNSTFGLKVSNSGGLIKNILKLVDADDHFHTHFLDHFLDKKIVNYVFYREFKWDSLSKKYLIENRELTVDEYRFYNATDENSSFSVKFADLLISGLKKSLIIKNGIVSIYDSWLKKFKVNNQPVDDFSVYDFLIKKRKKIKAQISLLKAYLTGINLMIDYYNQGLLNYQKN